MTGMRAANFETCSLRIVLLAAVLFLVSPVAAFAACETPASATAQMNQLVQQDIKNINNYINQEFNFIDSDLSNTAVVEITTRFNEFNDNILNWLSNWWFDASGGCFLCSLVNMTKQLNAMQVDQSRMLGSMMDAQITNEFIADIQQKEVEAQKRYRPHELTCQLDTAMASSSGGVTKVTQMSRALSRGYALEEQTRRGNTTGTAAASGRASDMKEFWDQYVASFCDPALGNQGCTVAGTMPGKHVDLPGFLWGDQQTYDMAVPQNQELAKALQRYLVDPTAADVLQAKVLEAPAGREEIMKRRTRQARFNAIYNTVGMMVGERAGGSGVKMKDMRVKAGMLAGDPKLNASDDASYREIMQVLSKERFYDPAYITQIVNDPVEGVREQGTIKAVRMQLMNDFYRRSEERVFMEAAILAKELDDRTPGSALASRPKN